MLALRARELRVEPVERLTDQPIARHKVPARRRHEFLRLRGRAYELEVLLRVLERHESVELVCPDRAFNGQRNFKVK